MVFQSLFAARFPHSYGILAHMVCFIRSMEVFRSLLACLRGILASFFIRQEVFTPNSLLQTAFWWSLQCHQAPYSMFLVELVVTLLIQLE
jgi:hypothetical protein